MQHSRTLELVVGVFIFLGFGALLLLAMKVSNLSLSSVGNDRSFVVTAKFDNIGGLKIRSPVKLAGVVVGRVTGIRVDRKDFAAVVSMAIEADYDQIPADVSASIYTAGLLGEQYVSFDAASAGGVDEFLKDGDQITMTESAVVLERLIGQFLYNKQKES
jgi:phospholipid/cholesterol/gamma-HCH transport system substrate-binding protein